MSWRTSTPDGVPPARSSCERLHTGPGRTQRPAFAKSQLCEACHLLYQRGYVASNDGNLSLRLEDGRFLITPSGVSKGRITPEILVVCDGEGRVLDGDRHPSSEAPMTGRSTPPVLM